MKITMCLYFILLLNFSYAQSSKFTPQRKFITFQQTRLSPGLTGALGLARSANEIPNMSSSNHINIGGLIDISSPLSTIGFTVGANFYANQYKFGEKVNGKLVGDSTTVSGIEIPVFLRITTGSVGQANRLVIMPGIAYNIPTEAKLESSFHETIDDKTLVKNYLDYRCQIGWEFILGRKSRKEFSGQYVVDSRTRVLIFAGASYSRNPIYNEDYLSVPEPYVENFSSLSTNRAVNYYGGISVYFTISGWESVYDEVEKYIEENK